MEFKAVGFDYNGVISDGHSVDVIVLEIAKNLHANGYKTGILSNFGRSGADKIRSLGVAEHFDILHVSGETGFAKPMPESFIHLAESLGVDINQLVYIDDSPYNLSTAKETGFSPVLFESAQKLRLDLLELGCTL